MVEGFEDAAFEAETGIGDGRSDRGSPEHAFYPSRPGEWIRQSIRGCVLSVSQIALQLLSDGCENVQHSRWRYHQHRCAAFVGD